METPKHKLHKVTFCSILCNHNLPKLVIGNVTSFSIIWKGKTHLREEIYPHVWQCSSKHVLDLHESYILDNDTYKKLWLRKVNNNFAMWSWSNLDLVQSLVTLGCKTIRNIQMDSLAKLGLWAVCTMHVLVWLVQKPIPF